MRLWIGMRVGGAGLARYKEQTNIKSGIFKTFEFKDIPNKPEKIEIWRNPPSPPRATSKMSPTLKLTTPKNPWSACFANFRWSKIWTDKIEVF